MKKRPRTSAPPATQKVKGSNTDAIEVSASRVTGQAVVTKQFGSLELHVNVGGEVRVEGEDFSRELRLKKSELLIQDSLPVGGADGK